MTSVIRERRELKVDLYLDTDSSFIKGERLCSPIQEHQIDFLLEEEFACNPSFLEWFVSKVERHPSVAPGGLEPSPFMPPQKDMNCKAVRSVTTGDGETDVLVVYRAAGTLRVAILIEDKIRAGFQPDQAERYRIRGEKGKASGHWDLYWTCLVAPNKYLLHKDEFDGSSPKEKFEASLSLEELQAFFSDAQPRSHFKAGVLQRAVKRFEESGLQVEDEQVTRFRAFYADQAEAALAGTGIKWPVPRAAWWDDRWFRFTGTGIPAGAEILYKARLGFVDLAFPGTEVAELERLLTSSTKLGSSARITARQTGRSASFRIEMKPLCDFGNTAAATPTIIDSLRQVQNLVGFYKENATVMTQLTSRISGAKGAVQSN